ncbi:uncharacterized protein LOC125499119 [Beta vulgaris subsp. vulgaris]|uniref:uncharacterized protein LOC125499119 n=3 Tax=Beta vulgaris subsp. vulgaris TaxID=3555 RepID=UPI002546B11A|nr:uncharacterized protein LOC125499119 [Beta vulgaris subsp. vulgaris]
MYLQFQVMTEESIIQASGCVSALTLAVIHNFKCRNLDYSNVSKPFISYWQDEKDLTDVVKQFEINMDFILPVKREKQKVEFKTPSVSVASRKSGSPIIKVVEGPSPSTRQLIMDLPHSLMTDEEIDALGVPEYVKNMHKLKRNALAFCQVNLEIAQNIREEGEKLSQDSISLDDSEVFNPDFLSQIDDICKRHLEAKDSANKVDPTISLLVKRPVELEIGRIENVPDLDSGVHGVDLKEGNDEKEGEEDEKKMNADDDQHKEDDDDDDDDGDDKDHQNHNERKDDDADDNGDPGLQGDEDKGVDKDADLHVDEDKGGDNGDPGLQGDEDKVGDKDAGLHGDGEEDNEKEPKEDGKKKTGNADDDCGLQGDKEEGGNKELDAGVYTEGEKGGNFEKEQPKEADRKRRNADDDQVKGAKDKDKCKISTHVPTRTAAGIDIVDLRTPTPPPPPPPVVEAVENVYSRKSWRVDSSAKKKNIADFDAPSFQLLTPSPVVEDLPYSEESGEGVGSSIPIITPVNVKYPRCDGSYSDQSSYKSYKPQKQSKSEIPATPELLKGWDYDPSSEKVGKVVRVKEPGDDYDDEGLEDLIDRIADHGVESSSDKAKKEEDDNEAGVVSSSTPGLHAVPVNNHGIILCRSLQHYNRYLSDLSPDQRLLVDYLFYNEYEDVAYMSLDTDSEEVKMKNDIMQSELTSDLIVDFDNPHSNYAVQLYKFDLISMPRQGWLTSGVIDGCAFMFNRQEEESPSATRRFWFNIMPFNYINWLCAEKVKKVQFESEIAENEIILKNLEGTRQYDQKFKEWEENKKKLITKDDDLFYKKCKEAISSWVKSFPRNDIREAELIFVPVHKDDHYTVLVLNKKAKRIENIDNRTDMKDIDRYKHEEFNGLTYFCRAFDSFMQETMRCRDFDRLHHWQTSTLYFPWRSKDNNFDCGVYAIKTMELYDGHNTNHAALVDLKRAATKNLERCRLAVRLVDHPLNKLREKVKHDCYVWSAKKPELMARQKIRKDKEAVLDKLAFNRSKKTNRKEAHILRRRRDHEAKVEDVLNNNFGDKVKIEQLLKFHYC